MRYVLALCATLLAAAGLVTSARANTVPVGGGSLPALRLFDVYLDDRHIGQHRYELAPQADGGLRLRSEARFELKLLGLTAYRYRHEAHELWREGCLAELRAETLDNGKPSRVQVQPREGCTMSYAYWDMRFSAAAAYLLWPIRTCRAASCDSVSKQSHPNPNCAA